MKASQNVPEAQKGVDLKISVDGKLLTTARFAGETAVGEPTVIILDGVSRPQDVGGQKATVVAKWLKPGTWPSSTSSRCSSRGASFPRRRRS